MSAAGHQASQPPLRRDRQSAVVAGVCAGLGRRLGIDPIILRVIFIAATAAGGLGVGLYLLGWVAMPAEGERRSGGLRVPALPGGRDSWTVAGGIGLLALALLLVFRQWGLWIGDALVWPVVLAAAGGALIWRQSANAADPAPAREAPARVGGGSALGRAALGVALVVGAALLFLYFNDALRPARDVLLPAVVVLVAGTLILAPWWIRLVRGLADERAERVRSQERAELAAHLRDSVLQTLALMQRRAENPREVAGLARRQERELRAWLNGGRPLGERGTLAAALELAAAEVEENHGVAVDVVTVGDCPLDAGAEGSWPPRARPSSTPPSSPAPSRSRSTPRSARSASRCSCATAARGSTPTRSRRTGAGCASRSWAACAATAATPSCTRARAPAPRSSCGWSGRDDRARPERRHRRRPPAVPLRRARRARRAGRGARRRRERRDAVRCIVELEPDVVLLDVQMPGGGGVQVIRDVAKARPAQRFLALSVSDAAEDVIAIIRAGARGYVTKTISGPELADAVRRVADGDAVFSPRLAGFVLDAFAGAGQPIPSVVDPELDQLTAREREVLQHIARGYLYKEIGARLHISAKTVEAHVSAVLRKLQLSNRHELSRWAVERRLID